MYWRKNNDILCYFPPVVLRDLSTVQLLNNKPSLRGVVLRPSLVWTKSRPGSLLPVAAFQLGR